MSAKETMASDDVLGEAGVAEDQKAEFASEALATATEHTQRSKNRILGFLQYLASFVIPGMGMFCEAYFVFSVGNLKPLWEVEYPGCWKAHTECSVNLSNSISYTQVSGIIFGQLSLGFLADRMGRKAGSIFCAATMLIFGILLAASVGSSVNAQFAMFTAVQFLFGIGVGGEYPVASASANERAEATAELSKRRGETVVCVFSMQGWGNLVNTLLIAILMAIFGQTGQVLELNPSRLNVIWRLSYAIGLIPLAGILAFRIWVLRESAVWTGKREALKKMGKVSNADVRRKYMVLLRYYWHRNFGTALSWFVWDFAFYGNKLFQGTFIKIINPYATNFEVLLWTSLNSFVALCGYYFAAFTIDRQWMGRTRMQAMGFLWIGFLFLMCTMFYHQLSSKALIHAFQFLYYFSSFWGQFGPNATTWLLPAELAPTEVRSLCHGVSAAVGKAGALVAGVIFGLCNNQTKFTISAACGLVGAIVTYIFIPDLTGLDLREGDKRWLAILDGRGDTYTGEAVNPKHLSMLENFMGYGKTYQAPGLDAVKGDHHTTAVTVAGMVVATHVDDGPGEDDVHEVTPLAAKQASFEAKQNNYI